MTLPPSRTGLTLGTLRWSMRIRQSASLRSLYRVLSESSRRRIAGAAQRSISERTGSPPGPAWDQVSASDIPKQRSEQAALAVNIVVYLKGRLGLGESSRRYASALMEHGAQVSLQDVDLDLAHDWNEDATSQGLSERAPHPVTLFFVNPDVLRPPLAKVSNETLHNRRKVACWFWELEQIPASRHRAIDQMDGLIVASDFVGQALRQDADKPILRMPLPMVALPASQMQRANFGLEDKDFIFLGTSDFKSGMVRKNPQATIAAFRSAFPVERKDVKLLIKTSNGFRYPEHLQTLLEPAAEDARIMVRDDVIEGRHVRAVATLLRRLCFIASGRRFRAGHGREHAGRQSRDCHAMVGQPGIHGRQQQLLC